MQNADSMTEGDERCVGTLHILSFAVKIKNKIYYQKKKKKKKACYHQRSNSKIDHRLFNGNNSTQQTIKYFKKLKEYNSQLLELEAVISREKKIFKKKARCLGMY